MKLSTAKYFSSSPYKHILLFVAFLIFSNILFAKGEKKLKINQLQSEILFNKKSGCAPATVQRELNINNVRARILNGGDLWWDLSSAKYEIPKVASGQISKSSLFAGAIWVGGVTNGNLRLAAQKYRQNSNDYYPGPLDINTASITTSECLKYDKIWGTYLTDIDNFRKNPSNWLNPINDIGTWPAMGDVSLGEAKYLAPFFDNNGDGIYDPAVGDYPSFDQNSSKNIPDQMMWWVYNDKGNIHSESFGMPIGLEFQEQAFAYSTNDEINNMTFYRTKIINRSSEKFDSCIIGQWVDPDLGFKNDDYIEFDVQRTLGICYNGYDFDSTINGYGLNPPSIGINFLEGPKRSDGTTIGLTKFIYFNGGKGVNLYGNRDQPTNANQYWNYLNGRWKKGSQLTYGGTGFGGTDTTSFAFPGTTDPMHSPEWTERTANDTPGNRCCLMSSGPFSLLPGAINNVTIAVVWARVSSGGATGSINLLKQASDKAYSFYKKSFSTGINEINYSSNQNIIPFPNPGKDQIQLFNLSEDADEIYFYNLSGQECLIQKLKDSKIIETSFIQNGIYLYQIKNKQGDVIKTGKWFKD